MKPGQIILCTSAVLLLLVGGLVASWLIEGLTFGYQWVLIVLVVPVLLLIWEVLRTGQRLRMPFDHGRQREGSFWNTLILMANMLPALILMVVIVILAQPRTKDKPRDHRKLTNIEFCLDVSGSMSSSFGDGRRCDAAMDAITRFTTYRKGDAFGLTVFGNEVLRWVPLTQDLAAIRNATPFVDPDKMPHHFGGTEIGKAIKYCRDTLVEQETGDRLIILLSDGHSSDLYNNEASRIGQDLAAKDVTLYAIHIGEGGAPGDLYALAQPTGGEVFAVDSQMALDAVFKHIDTMTPAEFEPRTTHTVDRFGPVAIAGLAVLGLYVFTLAGLRFTPW